MLRYHLNNIKQILDVNVEKYKLYKFCIQITYTSSLSGGKINLVI